MYTLIALATAAAACAIIIYFDVRSDCRGADVIFDKPRLGTGTWFPYPPAPRCVTTARCAPGSTPSAHGC